MAGFICGWDLELYRAKVDGMINEISSNTSSVQYQQNDMTEEKSENVKDAFIELLQGLIGFMPSKNPIGDLIKPLKISDDRAPKEEIPKREVSTNDTSDVTDNYEESKVSNEDIKITKTENVDKQNVKSNQHDNEVVVETDNNTKSSNENIPMEDNVVKYENPFNKLQYNKVEEQIAKDSKVELNQSDKEVSLEAEVKVENTARSQVEFVDLENENLSNEMNEFVKNNSNLFNKVANGSDVVMEDLNKVLNQISEMVEKISPDESEDTKNELAKLLFNLTINPKLENIDNDAKAILQKSELPLAIFSQLSRVIDSNFDFKNIQSKSNSEIFGLGRGVGEKTEIASRLAKPLEGQIADQQKYVDKVKEVMNKIALSKTTDAVTVKIDPPHLGEITVRVVQKGKEVYAKLTAESHEVENILRTKMHELSSVLQQLGYKAEQVNVTIGNSNEEIPFFSNSFLNNNGSEWSSKEETKRFFMNAESGVGFISNTIKSNVEMSDGWVA